MPFFFNGFENIRFSHPKIKVPNINNWGYCQVISEERLQLKVFLILLPYFPK